MPAISAIFLVLSLVLAVTVGTQTRPWTWGPAMLALGTSLLAALPVFWRRGRAQADFALLGLGALTAGWFAWRACISPVAEFGQADLLLVCGAVGAFACVRAAAGDAVAERILAWGIALLLLASVLVAGRQVLDASYSPVYRADATSGKVIGFAAHYNEAANYFIASALLVAAAALFGRHATATRILFLLLTAAGLACVWLTRSRGGIFGAAVGCGVLAAVALMIAKRRNAKWFAPALIAVPLIGLAIGAFWIVGWREAQSLRFAGSGVTELLDNTGRLQFLGLALSCIGLHPMTGGGSRSFSWECFRFVSGKDQGIATTRLPDLVHNELLQCATDYGLAGAGLLAGLLASLAVAVVLRTLFEDRPREQDSTDAWRLGGTAALAGMLVQSCFSFVFHLMPGVLLLGICLGLMSRAGAGAAVCKTAGVRIVLTLAAVACALVLMPAGWKGTMVYRILWQTWFSKQPETSAEARIDALDEAIRVWPQSALLLDRASIHQELARSMEGPGFVESAELAVRDFQHASRLHPYDPVFWVNQANLLSQLRRDEEAENAYARAIELQGGMEPAFRGRFSLANHHLRKGLREFRTEDPGQALDALESAAAEIERAVGGMHWVTKDMLEPRVSIHESLGTARETAGDREGALAAYNFAASLPKGARAHYRAGVLIGKTAVEAWSKRRPSEALARFIEARKRVGQAGKELPQGVTASQRAEFVDYLDRTIAFLKGAKVQPAR